MMTFERGVDVLSDALFVLVSLVALIVLPRVVADLRACRRALERPTLEVRSERAIAATRGERSTDDPRE